MLGSFAERLLLKREDVVEDALDPPSLEAVVRDQPGLAEKPAKSDRQRSVNPHLAGFKCLLEDDKALVENLHPLPALDAHWASTRTRPASTLTLKVGNRGTA